MKMRNDNCPTLVSGALNDTEKIRKASADIFANVGLEKARKDKEKHVSLTKLCI